LAIVIVTVIVVVVGAFAYMTYGPGTLEILITDPPSRWGQASQIYINYSAIEIHRADASDESGWITIVDSTAWINLTQTLDVNQTIGSKSLQTGKYNLIRFSVFEAIITVANVNYTATVPSGKLQIAVTQGGISINAGQTARLLIELNARVEGSIESGFRLVPDVRATPV
jgi:hypothetical protein